MIAIYEQYHQEGVPKKKSFFRRFSKKFFIWGNLIAAVLLVLGSYSKFFFSPTFWPVGLIPLTNIYLAIILIAFCIFWLCFRSKWSVVLPICFIICWKPLQHLIPFRFGEKFKIAKQQSDLRVMSWNVAQFDIMDYKRRPFKKNAMIDLVNQYQPDVVCFQEMVAGDTLVNLNTPYYRKYSFFPVYQFAEKMQIPNYFFSYNYKEDFLIHQHFGLIVFSKYPIINKQMVSSFPHGYNDFFQYIDIVKGIDTFRVFNIHLQSLRFSQSNLKYIDDPSIETSTDLEKSKSVIAKFKRALTRRKLQTDLIKKELDKSPYPVILCGDFNDVPNSYSYQTIGDGLQNCFKEKGSGIGRTFSAISPTLRIDNIFVAPQFSVQQFTRINKLLSDHYPIVTDLQFNKQ